MNGQPLTIRQHQLLEAIERLSQANGFAPSLRELARELGLSLARIAQLVAVCESDGLLNRKARVARTWRVAKIGGGR